MAQPPEDVHLGLTARLVKLFLLSKLPTIIILVSLLAGAASRRPPQSPVQSS